MSCAEEGEKEGEGRITTRRARKEKGEGWRKRERANNEVVTEEAKAQVYEAHANTSRGMCRDRYSALRYRIPRHPPHPALRIAVVFPSSVSLSLRCVFLSSGVDIPPLAPSPSTLRVVYPYNAGTSHFDSSRVRVRSGEEQDRQHHSKETHGSTASQSLVLGRMVGRVLIPP